MKFTVNQIEVTPRSVNLIGTTEVGNTLTIPLWIHGIPREYHRLLIERLEGREYDVPTWETFRHNLDTPSPTTYHIPDFTPGEALFCLSINRHQDEDDEDGGNQRSLAFPQVIQWLRLMEQGDFRLCPEGVVLIPQDRSAGNAQHRNTSGVLFNRPFPMTVSTGWTPAVLATLDQGRNRTLSDQSAIAGGYAWRPAMGPQKTVVASVKLIHDEAYLDRVITPESMNDILRLFGPSFRVVREYARTTPWLRHAGTMTPWVAAHRVHPQLIEAALRAISTGSIQGPGGERHPLRVIYRYVNPASTGSGMNADKKKKPSSTGSRARGSAGAPSGNQIIFRKIMHGLLNYMAGRECSILQSRDYIVPTFYSGRANILDPLFTYEQQSSLDIPAALPAVPEDSHPSV